MDVRLSPEQLADMWGITTSQLYKMRLNGSGPPFIKISRKCIVYRLADVEAWENSRKKTHTGQS